ncbi:MAG: hypothetical protein D6732_22030 [Methanobacteriota archaeon]|nr:MAG: hypothetical protein D6732_22030 [Euryarchaeota archaeon]
MNPLEQVVDSALIGIDHDNVSTPNKWKNHRTDSSFVGNFLTFYLTNDTGIVNFWSTAPDENGRWYSENLDGLSMIQAGNIIGTQIPLPLVLPSNNQPAEGQEFWIRYKLVDDDYNGTIAQIDDEIDRWISY